MFINVAEKNNLNNIKISNDINNSSYTLGLYGIVYQGVPDILYTNIIYIGDTKQIWTHGVLYNCQSNIESKIADLENNNISDREIKDIIDSLTGEKIYVKGHADATYTNNGNTVSDVLDELYDLVGSHNKCIQLFCIEPVTVTINGVDTICNAGEQSTVFVGDKEFTITPTSNKSIKTISGYPIPLTWYDWLEGVDVFQNIVFDMNSPDMYNHWGQGYQGQYHVQEAQYINCIFWSDNPYTQEISNRTNYTLYNSTQLPLCYSSIRENTYKPFYFAYGVTLDPNWTNEDYIYSFSLTTGATQPWSYYGLRTIGVFNSAINPIKLPKDCRGLMFYSPAIESVGVLDAINTTNFGAKSGSWRDAFGTCYGLKNLYIKNLKTSINVSWSPINVESITYIVNNAVNTSKIYIYVSPYTYNILPDSLIQSAISKNIEISLIETNYNDDKRLKMLKMTGDGNSYLANDGTYKTIEIPATGTITGVSANGTSVATSGVADIPAASTSKYGVTKLSSATNSTSTSLAATASAVKAAYDLANGKQDELVSGTNIKTINGVSILGSGDIECATKTYVDDLVGDINSILENIINGGLITFTIDGVQYKASENMTWINWVNSSHNVDNYIFHSGDTYYVIYNSNYSRYVQGVALDYTGTNGTIIANENYTTGVVDWPV